MPTTIENLSMIRNLLDNPDPDKPSDPKLFEFFGNQVMHHKSRLQNSGAPWDVEEYLLEVSAGTEDYIVPVGDFGKPFLVYSEDQTDQFRPRVEIPFSLIQNTDMFWSGPRQVHANNSNTNTAVAFTFFKKAGGFYARVTPIPGGSTAYKIWYEVAPAPPGSLGDTPGITPFHHLIRIQTAIAGLPYCAWGDLRVDAEKDKHVDRWKTKITMFGAVFKDQEAKFDREFSTYIGSLMQSGAEAREGFGDEYMMDDWGYGVGSFGPNSL
jgi:hypothetical protein